MGKADYLLLGDWNVQCYQCGFKDKASKMVRNWQGYYVHPHHNEPRQTQDFVRGVPDNQLPPWVQPWPAVVYNYNNQIIGLSDGVTRSYQLGDGLYPTTVTQVQVNGVVINPAQYSTNAKGLITFATSYPKGNKITATGSETMA